MDIKTDLGNIRSDLSALVIQVRALRRLNRGRFLASAFGTFVGIWMFILSLILIWVITGLTLLNAAGAAAKRELEKAERNSAPIQDRR